MTLSEAISGVLAIDPAADAIEFDHRWTSWGALDERAVAVATLLDELGLPSGTRVGVLLRNHVDLVPVLFALLRTHRCLASLNAVSPDHKLAEDITDAACPVLVGTEADLARPAIAEAASGIGAALVAMGSAGPRLVHIGRADERRRASAPDVAIEMLSSGTTGKPKRIPLARRNLEKALAGAAAFEKGRDVDAPPRLRSGVQIVTAPLAHIAGITGLMNNILAGRKICLIDRFTVEAFRDAVVRHRPKVAGAPPSALRMLLDADIPKEDFSSLVAYRTGTAPLDPDLADAFYERYGIPVLQNYGATEFAGGVAGWTLEDFHAHWKARRGSVGRLNPGVEAQIVDPDTGVKLPPGEIGLLELRAPNVADGVSWVRTTDLAMLDTERFLWIKGRHDGAIVRGGFKILPDDVLKVIQEHPAVREAAVIGLKDRRLGEVPVAAWVARAGADPVTEEALKSWLRARLLPYQVPVRILQFDELPRTPSLKVSQPLLREMFEGLV